MKITNLVALVCTTLMFGGCSMMGVKKSAEFQYSNVVTDLVGGLYQIKGMAPIKTTLSMSPPKGEFGAQLYNELRGKGYGIRMIKKGEVGGHVVSYSSDRISRYDVESMLCQLKVGDIKLTREYEVERGRAFPISSMSVSGGEPAYSKLDDESNFNYSSLKDKTLLRQQNNSDEQPVFVNENTNQSGFKGRGECGLVNDTHNVDDLGHSNYKEIFEGYVAVFSDVIAFDNDSIIVNGEGDRRLAELLKNYNDSSDLISVLGVSRGNTAVKNGNSELARARAHSLKESLVGRGVKSSKVFSEAAWSSKEGKGVARGVKVVIMRRKG